MAVSVTANVPADLNACCTTSPDAVAPSSKFQSHCTIVPVVEVLCDASKSAGSLSAGDPGVTVNTGVTLLRGGSVVPPGTTRIDTVCAVAFPKSETEGVTTMSTVVAGAGPAGAGGAVKTTVALPFASVTTLRADSRPKSTRTFPTPMSTRIEALRSGWPLASRAVMVTSDCDAPSWLRTSGLTVMSIEVLSPDGP